MEGARAVILVVLFVAAQMPNVMPSSLTVPAFLWSPHNYREDFSALVNFLEKFCATYTVLYASDPYRSLPYPSHLGTRFLAEDNISSNSTLCDGVCQIKSSLLEGLFFCKLPMIEPCDDWKQGTEAKRTKKALQDHWPSTATGSYTPHLWKSWFQSATIFLRNDLSPDHSLVFNRKRDDLRERRRNQRELDYWLTPFDAQVRGKNPRRICK